MKRILEAIVALVKFLGLGRGAALASGWDKLTKRYDDRLSQVEARLEACERDRDALWQRILKLEQSK